MNDSSSPAFVNNPISNGIPTREQNSVANTGSEEDHATSITPTATSFSGDEGSDKAMDSNDITKHENAAQHHHDSSNSHHPHVDKIEPSLGSMNDTLGNAAYASSVNHQQSPESVPHHELNGSAPAHLSGDHDHSNTMSAGEAEEMQAIVEVDMELNGSAPAHLSGDPDHSSSSNNNMSAGEAEEMQAIVDVDMELNGSVPAHLSGDPDHSSNNNMSAGEAEEMQAIVDNMNMEIQDSLGELMHDGTKNDKDDQDDVSNKFGSDGLAGGSVPVQQQYQQQIDSIQDEAAHHISNVQVNAMNPISVDVAHESADCGVPAQQQHQQQLNSIPNEATHHSSNVQVNAMDPISVDVAHEFAGGGVPVQQPRLDSSSNEATYHSSNIPVNAMDPISVDVAHEFTGGGVPAQQQQLDSSSNAPVNAMDPISVDVAHESATQQQASAEQQVEPTAAQALAAAASIAAAASSADAEVIDLLDDDDDDAKSDNTDDLITKALISNTGMNQAKRQKLSDNDNGNQTDHASYQSQWTQGTPSLRHSSGAPIEPPGQSLNVPTEAKISPAARISQAIQQAHAPPQQLPVQQHQPNPQQPSLTRPKIRKSKYQPMPPQPSMTPRFSNSRVGYDEPYYVPLPHDFVPTWNEMVPAKQKPKPPPQYQHRSHERKNFQLSLLNVNEFTITGLPISFDGPATSISGMRVPIRQVSREHGKAVYERDKEGGPGKWRIPLGAYHAFFAYLRSDPNCRVDGIPSLQLKVASLERARQEKGYPSVEKLVEAGVPNGLARTLAPFQRGGVDFVLEKKGRALIADGMYILVYLLSLSWRGIRQD
jgi:hypothetical protein